MERLSELLNRLSLSAGVFYTGNICGVHGFEKDTRRGHMHLIRHGPVKLIGGRDGCFSITEPTLVFMPSPDAHQLIADEREGADVVCAAIMLGAGRHNPIADSLPSLVLIPLSQLAGAHPLLELLYDEAFSNHCGKQASLDRLCELLMIRVLRYCVDNGITNNGTLSGLADPRLAKVLTAIHGDAAHQWELSEMAQVAGMSRARFALHFRKVVGQTPASYLSSWRLTLAQALLRAGRPLKHVAIEVGYGSASALTRAFSRKLGTSPKAWLRTV
ncbi:MAG: AraC family transcriptional regulator [Ralstonia sp.]|jgi:AraC-like DNA-binding protein|uniref:RCS-specific HTH-type transcriptional activator RclR n=2 Tax=Ralstonia TaxID=48736 RepID=A0ABN9IVI7_9RALS|nr:MULTISPECIES: AraC family transcriptional regulator [Ralstonia]MBA9845271.1 AraC family transcriptional regulator [Ralstonia pickettii]MBA9852337.1 AraC family transcriptional regulator [Ralstonia pickettii]MBA9878691.1 AraC family transcriptional regulator [Ralstonia pickettii]MBA9881924.1 AraC family transcriptional regulator [Ralstonia pickettii]MBA9888767.1 AraC family transcriptional regulator [Ralstonia pickettii]